MKSFFSNAIIFLFGFFVVVAIPVILISEYDNTDNRINNNHNIISLQTKSNYDSLDILFVGGSYCYSSINTIYLDSLHISSFNLGIATAGVQFYELILNDYFLNIKSVPKKVLIMISPLTFSSICDNFNAYPIHRYLKYPKSNFEIAWKYNKLDEIDVMYKKSLRKAIANIRHRKSTSPAIQQFNNKGYWPSDKLFSKEGISKEEAFYLPLKNEAFEKSRVEDLLNIAISIERKGSEVIFFELPANLVNSYLNKTFLTDYENALLHIKERFALLSIDPSLFSDKNYRNIDHMNSSGANIATKEIVNLLRLNKVQGGKEGRMK